MDLSKLSSLTGGGGLDSSSSAGGNDQLQGGANISFGYLPAVPSLPSLPGMPSLPAAGNTSVSMQASGLLPLAALAVVALFVYFFMMRGR